jgi:Methyltransferase FkbM domain
MGIDTAWRVFEPHLHAHGFDPQESEIERLAASEKNAHVHYHAALVGLPDDHAYHLGRRQDAHQPYFDPINRSSSFAASAQQAEQGRRSLEEMNSWQVERLTSAKLSLSDFARESALTTIDFVKTDTDGGDYEVLLSATEAVTNADILGFMVETPYNAAPTDHAHALHTVDLFLRRQGFLLYTMSVNRYSRAALPAPFASRVLAQTTFGQVMWGDTIYLRDGGSPDYAKVWDRELSPAKLLKLACLYEIFRVPDSAVELLLLHRESLRDLVDVDHSLDLLTPPLNGKHLSYADYIAAFEQDPFAFYPSNLSLAKRAIQRGDRDAIVRAAGRAGARVLEAVKLWRRKRSA